MRSYRTSTSISGRAGTSTAIARYSGGNINSHWTLINNWSFGIGLQRERAGFADRLTRGGPGGYVPGNVSQWGYFDTDGRKRVVRPTFFGILVQRPRGLARLERRARRDLAADDGAVDRASASTSATNVNDDAVGRTTSTTPARTHYVFGRIDQTTVGISMRVNYTITPTLSLQIYAQPFVSAGAYADFKELVNGRAAHYADRYAPYAYARQSRLQLPLVPHDERAALGIPPGLRALRRLAAGPRGR